MEDRKRSKPRQSAKDRALGLLGVRWRSREELRRRLRQAGYEPDDIDRALADLTEVGLIEDGRFARELVRDQATRRHAGDRAILSALRQKGVSADVAEVALGQAGDEAERARDLAARRAARMMTLAPDAACTITVTFTPSSGDVPSSGTLNVTDNAAGGTQSFTVPVGTCTGQVFYPQGTAVTVTENVPEFWPSLKLNVSDAG